MTFRRRFKLSEQQRTDMWKRWKAGQSLHEIGRAFRQSTRSCVDSIYVGSGNCRRDALQPHGGAFTADTNVGGAGENAFSRGIALRFVDS